MEKPNQQTKNQTVQKTVQKTIWRREHVEGAITKKGASVRKVRFYVRLERIEKLLLKGGNFFQDDEMTRRQDDGKIDRPPVRKTKPSKKPSDDTSTWRGALPKKERL
jgi:hypothetical protein